MRNLTVLGVEEVKLPESVIQEGEESDWTFCLLGEETDAVLLASSRRTGQILKVQRQAEVVAGPTFSAAQYVPALQSLFVGNEEDGSFSQGSGGDVESCEELFKCQQGIAKFQVSPDGRRLAILTKERTLLVLTLPDLSCLVVHKLDEETEAQESDPVQEPQGCSRGSIAWRNDSHYFAVNVKKASKGREEDGASWIIKVFDEDGKLYSTSSFEDYKILNHTLAWQPSGGLLACFGESSHGKVVVLFELNGLQRSCVPLERNDEVVGIEWNQTSDILAVLYQDTVQLWTRNNYVWMLKKSFTKLSQNGGRQFIQFCGWDLQNPNRLVALYADSSCTSYYIGFEYSRGLSKGSSLAVSWNGNKLYCTPFRENVAPPPYGFSQLETEAAVVDVIVSDFWDGFLCVTTSGIVIFRHEKGSLSRMNFNTFPENFPVLEAVSWSWPNMSTICCICRGNIMTATLKLQVSEEKAEQDQVHQLSFSTVEDKGNRLFSRVFPYETTTETDQLLVETDNGSLLKLSLTETTFRILFTGCSSRNSLSRFKIFHYNINSETVFIFLDVRTNQLYTGLSSCPSSLISTNLSCSSVIFFFDNILMTTVQGTLEIVSKEAFAEGARGSCDINKIDKFSRRLEAGSHIVTCCINRLLEPSLILQIIPRGNFETICPRPLLISCIRTTLRDSAASLRYEKIMTALRRHRLDYKVFINEMRDVERDFPDCTLRASLREMIEEVRDSHSLVLLVTDLDDEYNDCIQIIKDLLDEKVREEAERQPNIEEAYLACLAKLGMLEEALLSKLIQGESNEKRSFVTHRVKFLSYYCDNPNVLFDTSLGTYDLSLASLVGDCLGKDPKEFVPILEELNSFPELKRKFRIDDKLRRYAKAVIHLIQDSTAAFPEVLKYMERHRLFSDAIAMMEQHLSNRVQCDRTFDDIAKLLELSKVAYGEYLEEHGKFREAIIMYRGGMHFDKAVDCSVKSGEWENALDAFYRQNKGASQDELLMFCEKVLNVLEEKKNYSGAARLCEVHLQNYELAVDYYIRDKKWKHARSLSHRLLRSEEDIIRKRVVEIAVEKKETFITLRADISQHFNRWKIVKETKAQRLLNGGLDDFPDNFSDTDSMSSYSTRSGSSGTGKTTRSGKNRRKLERKLYSMKEGSRYEDLAITSHLWNTIDNVQQTVKPEASDLIAFLWEEEEVELARELGSAFDSLVQACGEAVQEIWATVILDDLLEMKYRTPPPNWTVSWDKLCLHEPSSKASAVNSKHAP